MELTHIDEIYGSYVRKMEKVDYHKLAVMFQDIIGGSICRSVPMYECVILLENITIKQFPTINMKNIYSFIVNKRDMLMNVIETIFTSTGIRCNKPILARSVLKVVFHLVQTKMFIEKLYLLNIIKKFRKWGHQYIHLYDIHKAVMFYIRNGSDGIIKQQLLCKKWFEKRKKAALKIADYWFKHINNPYTESGKRMLLKRGVRFQQQLLPSSVH